jgi:hypothetical protein
VRYAVTFNARGPAGIKPRFLGEIDLPRGVDAVGVARAMSAALMLEECPRIAGLQLLPGGISYPTHLPNSFDVEILEGVAIGLYSPRETGTDAIEYFALRRV